MSRWKKAKKGKVINVLPEYKFDWSTIYAVVRSNHRARRDLGERLNEADVVAFDDFEWLFRAMEIADRTSGFQRECDTVLLTAIAQHKSMRVHFTQVATPGLHSWTTSQIVSLTKAIIANGCVESLIDAGPRWSSYVSIALENKVFQINSNDLETVRVLSEECKLVIPVAAPAQALHPNIKPWLPLLLDLADAGRLRVLSDNDFDDAPRDYIWPVLTSDLTLNNSQQRGYAIGDAASMLALSLLFAFYSHKPHKSARMMAMRPRLKNVAFVMRERQELMERQIADQHVLVHDTIASLGASMRAITASLTETTKWHHLVMEGKCVVTLEKAMQSLNLRHKSINLQSGTVTAGRKNTVYALRSNLYETAVVFQQCLTLSTAMSQPFPIDLVLYILQLADDPYVLHAKAATVESNERNMVRDIVSTATKACSRVYENAPRQLALITRYSVKPVLTKPNIERRASAAIPDTSEHVQKRTRRFQPLDYDNDDL